jgi:hypothetical protein
MRQVIVIMLHCLHLGASTGRDGSNAPLLLLAGVQSADHATSVQIRQRAAVAQHNPQHDIE